ncbi:hypothetical protein BJF93_22390 [Xaviernesmea oryzae]|uniref:Response regulatory domain-containing protein n=1 Tax=Xaviernesmea oryzae TaxID=464029 RepID=A0A1Q9B324_9HYPH|nr:response regulator [Xaviernesmea oryzae]OLP62417.1 hypothetical protein BJF93_22390 [Xaviernesmea oryzae]SEM15719.1 Response regulator receiver domain-containing protein [Xaviernesmea oryzae]
MTLASILMVDDDESDLFIAGYTIRKFNPDIAVLQARNGREALDVVQAGRPDVILLDVNMPVMDGFEFLEHLARLLKDRSPMVVMLTSSHLPADRKRAHSYDFVRAYVEKPLKGEDMAMLAGLAAEGDGEAATG